MFGLCRSMQKLGRSDFGLLLAVGSRGERQRPRAPMDCGTQKYTNRSREDTNWISTCIVPGRRPGFRSPHDPSEKDVPRRVVYTTMITKVTPAKSKRHQDALIEVAQTMQNPFRMYVAQLEKK